MSRPSLPFPRKSLRAQHRILSQAAIQLQLRAQVKQAKYKGLEEGYRKGWRDAICAIEKTVLKGLTSLRKAWAPPKPPAVPLAPASTLVASMDAAAQEDQEIQEDQETPEDQGAQESQETQETQETS